MRLTDFKALSFDCYGTLIDWERGLYAGLRGLARTSALDLTRDEVLQAYARLELQQLAEAPSTLYCDALAIVYARLAELWQVPVSQDECGRFGNSVASWPPFDDTSEALRYLGQHFKLIILSNIDNRSFSGTLGQLGVHFDAIYTAEAIGSYKPSDANFEYLKSRVADLGVGQGELLHVAQSLFHDHIPANRHGLANCWIDRRQAQDGLGATAPPATMPRIAFRFLSLADLAQAHRDEVACGRTVSR